MRSAFSTLVRQAGLFSMGRRAAVSFPRSFSMRHVDSMSTVLAAMRPVSVQPPLISAALAAILRRFISHHLQAALVIANEGDASSLTRAAAYRAHAKKQEALHQFLKDPKQLYNSSVAGILLEVAEQISSEERSVALEICSMLKSVYAKGTFLHDRANRLSSYISGQGFEIVVESDGVDSPVLPLVNSEILHEEIKQALCEGQLLVAHAKCLKLKEHPSHAEVAHEIIEGLKRHLGLKERPVDEEEPSVFPKP